jgi:hypothetical protein
MRTDDSSGRSGTRFPWDSSACRDLGPGPIVAIGELLWDLLPDGPHLGGAPFNVAVNLHRLGRPTVLVSAAGADDAGDRAISEVERWGVDNLGPDS